MLAVYRIDSKFNKLDHSFFEWAQPLLRGYDGVNSIERLLKTIGPILNLTKDEMESYSEMVKAQSPEQVTILFNKEYLSLLDANIVSVAGFDLPWRTRLLEIKTRIGYLNELAEQARYYFTLTFENKISEGNYSIAVKNLENCYKMYASQARMIVENIKRIAEC